MLPFKLLLLNLHYPGSITIIAPKVMFNITLTKDLSELLFFIFANFVITLSFIKIIHTLFYTLFYIFNYLIKKNENSNPQ